MDTFFESRPDFNQEYDYESLDHYGGFGYSNRGSEDFKEIARYITNKSKQRREQWTRGRFRNLFDALPSTWVEFLSEFDRFNSKGGGFSGYPIFQWVSPEDLLQKLCMIKAESLSSFVYALKERYELKISNGTFNENYKSEIDFLQILVSLIESKGKSESRKSNLSQVYLEMLAKQIEEVISSISTKYGIQAASSLRTEEEPPKELA